MKLSGKVALVTGSSQGIGQSIAERLAAEGADIIVNYHSHPEEGDTVKANIEKLGRRAISIGADLGTVAGAQKLIADGVAGLGQIDLLINNAGVEKNASFWDVTEHDYDLVLNTNLKGPFFVTQAFVRHLQSRKAAGKIINISSVHEDLPFPHFTAYCASKGGLKMMTRNLSIELAPFGITINNVAPGAIENADQHQAAQRSRAAQGASRQHPARPPGQTGRRRFRRRLPRFRGIRLHHRHHARDRRRADLELFRAVGAADG